MPQEPLTASQAVAIGLARFIVACVLAYAAPYLIVGPS